MDDRITELEVKLSHQEKLVDELNQVIIEQWRDIDLLKKKFNLLNDMVRQMDIKSAPPADEPPPHF